MSVANKILCQCLDSVYREIDYKTVKDAIISLNSSGKDGRPNWLALDISYEKRPTGEMNVSSVTPVEWSEWVKLPIREEDLTIKTAKSEIRVPTVIISRRFSDTIMKEPKLTKTNIRIRDRDTCQYTGRKLKPKDGNIDHVIPHSRGGGDTWENLVWCDKMLNFSKANKTPKEAGLTLIRKPFKPKSMPLNSVHKKLNDAHRDWRVFMRGD